MNNQKDKISKSRLGGLRRVELYGNPGTPEGRSKGGKSTIQLFHNNPELARLLGFVIRKEICYPSRSLELAELIGIILGDGGVRSGRQFTITFNYQTDFEYAKYICGVIKNLFSIDSSITKRNNNNGADVIVSSSNLIDFLLTQGIVMGHKVKNQVGVPLWIQEKLEYRTACLRGLMDTDGGVYFHNYRSAGKDYRYLKLGFTNCSKPLLDFALSTLSLLEIKAYLNGYHVSVYSKAGVKKYFEKVGSHNSKHINRFKAHFGEVPELAERSCLLSS